MNASSFIIFSHMCCDKMVNVSVKGYMSPLNWRKTYRPSNEGHVSILTNAMLRTNTSDIDERINLR